MLQQLKRKRTSADGASLPDHTVSSQRFTGKNMNWFAGNTATQFWTVLLCLAVLIAVSSAIAAICGAWKKRSVLDDEPLPQCNLEERLNQITEATRLQAKKTA
jgi:hypothetical protein